jgi:bifunctional DNase/RNase
VTAARALSLVLVAGCGAVQAPTTIVLAAPAAPPPSAPEPEAPPPREPKKPEPPPDYVEMHALRIEPSGDGAALVLADEAGTVMLRIFIGGTEATSIRLRMERRAYPRPLTHDLLDAAVRKLGGQVWKVHIDDLRSGTFIGRVFVRKGERILDLDARPSDAVALAIGDGVPLYVAKQVLEAAGERNDSGQDGGTFP